MKLVLGVTQKKVFASLRHLRQATSISLDPRGAIIIYSEHAKKNPAWATLYPFLLLSVPSVHFCCPCDSGLRIPTNRGREGETGNVCRTIPRTYPSTRFADSQQNVETISFRCLRAAGCVHTALMCSNILVKGMVIFHHHSLWYFDN